MARTAKQSAALKKAQASSAAKRKGRGKARSFASPEAQYGSGAHRPNKAFRDYPSKAVAAQGAAVKSKPAKPMKAPGVAKPTGQDAFTGQQRAIADAKKYGANKRRSAAATRNAYARVSDADFKAVMKGTKKPSRPRKKGR